MDRPPRGVAGRGHHPGLRQHRQHRRQNPNGILWNSESPPPAAAAHRAAAASLWVDPNSGLGATTIGISNIIVSTDDATYDAYFVPNTTGGLASNKVTYISHSSCRVATSLRSWPRVVNQPGMPVTGRATVLAADSTGPTVSPSTRRTGSRPEVWSTVARVAQASTSATTVARLGARARDARGCRAG